MKRVLVLGAGRVVKPLIDDLLVLPEVEIRLAALNIDRARQLLAGRPRSVALEFDAHDKAKLLPEVAESDVVISLLPADQHVDVAHVCLENQVTLITTSYVSAAMKALDEEARHRQVLLLNECGLDPGIDHMTATQVIRRVHREGAELVGFASYCGGLPAPEARDNPWGYKFTWSPRGVVMAARQPIAFVDRGTIVRKEFPGLFDDPKRFEFPGIGPLESYPNRDCLRYIELYGLDEVESFFRGTLRYPGWCESWSALQRVGLLDMTARDWSGTSYARFVESHLPPGGGTLIDRLARALDVEVDHDLISRLEWLGLLSERPVPETLASSVDVIAQRLMKKLVYKPGEHDMVLLQNEFKVRRADGSSARIVRRMSLFGQAGDDSAMARTVSLPAAIACRLILDGRVDVVGVKIPVDRQLSDPILLGLSRRGIRIDEKEEEVEG